MFRTLSWLTAEMWRRSSWLEGEIGRRIPPAEVTSFDVQRYRDHLLDIGRAPGGINRRLVALRKFFEWAVQASRIIRFQSTAFSIPCGSRRVAREADKETYNTNCLLKGRFFDGKIFDRFSYPRPTG